MAGVQQEHAAAAELWSKAIDVNHSRNTQQQQGMAALTVWSGREREGARQVERQVNRRWGFCLCAILKKQ